MDYLEDKYGGSDTKNSEWDMMCGSGTSKAMRIMLRRSRMDCDVESKEAETDNHGHDRFTLFTDYKELVKRVVAAQLSNVSSDVMCKVELQKCLEGEYEEAISDLTKGVGLSPEAISTLVFEAMKEVPEIDEKDCVPKNIVHGVKQGWSHFVTGLRGGLKGVQTVPDSIVSSPQLTESEEACLGYGILE